MLDSLKSSVNYVSWEFIRGGFTRLRKFKKKSSFEIMEIEYYSLTAYLKALHNVDAIPNGDYYFLTDLLRQVRFGRSSRVNAKVSLYRHYKQHWKN